MTILDLPSAFRLDDVSYLPRPNTVDVVLSDLVAPAEFSRSAFVIPFLDDGSIVLANVLRRGLEIPGGHVEPEETLGEAATRECLEEVGCRIHRLVPIGFLRLHSRGPMPDGWPYPYPVGAQQFFAASVEEMLPYEPNAECGLPSIVGPAGCHDVLPPFARVFLERARMIRVADGPRPPGPGV